MDLRHDEEMPPQPTAQDTSHGDRLLRRQEVLTARADAKTVAESAMEVSYVMQLSQALLEAGDIIQESTQARHRYLAVQKDHEEAKETQGESKRRATGTTRARAEAPTALPPVAAMSHEGSPELPRRVVDKVLGNLQHLPDSWLVISVRLHFVLLQKVGRIEIPTPWFPKTGLLLLTFVLPFPHMITRMYFHQAKFPNWIRPSLKCALISFHNTCRSSTLNSSLIVFHVKNLSPKTFVCSMRMLFSGPSQVTFAFRKFVPR